MIPEFPTFKKLELTDKEDIEKITFNYPPYSDFNFESMWCWNTQNEMRISRLNDNLVVRFTDYITTEPFYSFLGDVEVNDTVKKIIDFSEEEGLGPRLKLVPEISLKNLDNSFRQIEDRDNFDYILEVQKLSEHKSKKLRYHYNLGGRLKEEYGENFDIQVLNLADEKQRLGILALTETWIRNKASQNPDITSNLELQAIKRLFEVESGNSFSLGIFCDNKLVGCSINDLLTNEFSLCHFMKADSVFKGIYSCLFIETSKMMLGMGKKYMNIEQDLGLENLRQSKQSFEPAYFLKKFIVTRI